MNHLDLAVSQTSNPTGGWNIYRIDVTNDGTNTGGVNPGPYLGDYPHIGADANGIYLTTNAYPWCCNGFTGAQIYALSKAQLAAGAANVTMAAHRHLRHGQRSERRGLDAAGLHAVAGAVAGHGAVQPGNGGTEYFLSSNAADEATNPVSGTGGSHTSNQLDRLDADEHGVAEQRRRPALNLSNKILTVGQYGVPPKQQQPGSGTPPGTAVPQGHCLNDDDHRRRSPASAAGGCSLEPRPCAGPEVVSRPGLERHPDAAGDVRERQAVGRARHGAQPGRRSAAGRHRVVHRQPDAGQGRHRRATSARPGYDFTYPAIGVTPSGRGVMAFTATGDTHNPSAAYAPIDAIVGVGAWNDRPRRRRAPPRTTASPATRQQVFPNPIRSRWGDYGAAAVDGNSVWIASEYIAHACDYTDWGGPFFVGGTGDNLLGTCGGASHGPGARTALANWSTRISKLTP